MIVNSRVQADETERLQDLPSIERREVEDKTAVMILELVMRIDVDEGFGHCWGSRGGRRGSRFLSEPREPT